MTIRLRTARRATYEPRPSFRYTHTSRDRRFTGYDFLSWPPIDAQRVSLLSVSSPLLDPPSSSSSEDAARLVVGSIASRAFFRPVSDPLGPRVPIFNANIDFAWFPRPSPPSDTVATTGFRHSGTASRFASAAFRQFFSRRVSRYCVAARTAGTEGKRERERQRSDRASKQSKQVGLEQLRTHAHSSLGVLARI